MFKLIKLYSDENSFKAIDFKDGLNLICGEKSRNPDGTVSSNKQNGVGKSLSIELVNFCLLKKSNESRVSQISEDHLSPESFVNLHFKFNGVDYVISRNKKNQVKIKEGNGSFELYKFDDAKRMLNKILNFEDKLISAREYINFMIKEEDYSYKKFAELYNSSYADLLKVHFYFFDIPIETLESIKKAFDEYKIAQGALKKINQDLAAKDMDIKKLRAMQNQIDTQVEDMEKTLEYSDVIENLERENTNINVLEQELNNLMLEKKQYELELLEINSFSDMFGEDYYIDDKDLGLVFNKYKKGLGDMVSKDFNMLKKFRDQVVKFKSDLLVEKKKGLEYQIDNLTREINQKQQKISTYYKDIIDSKSSNFVKNFRLYKGKFSELDDYSADIKNYDRQEQIKNEARNNFSQKVSEINKIIKNMKVVEESFKKTFIKIHKAIMGSSECDFSFSSQNKFQAKSFFKFEVFIEGQGSKGVNQMQSVIYDLSLLENEHTRKNNLKCIIHDNLIFGSVDKDSSINALNYLSTLDPNSFQYIATVNKDDFDYAELKQLFKFNTDDSVVAELTKEEPLFPNWKS